MDDKLSYAALASRLRTAQRGVPLDSQWQHHKGGRYEIVSHAILEESQEVAVVYQPLKHPGILFVRPLSVWQESVDRDGRTIARFSRLD